ncbi:MAG: FkbM family methyltransferase [Anaerolineae bacterium]|nr:FkbM family methyltransferase [Anaerolineae bacterium]
MKTRLFYYLTSILTLLSKIKNWWVLLPLALGKSNVIIHLKNGCQFKVRSLMDVWIIKETCLDRDYEVNGITIRDGWTIIDIGAGLGDFAVCVGHEHPGSQIYAYEPAPESLALLKENLTLNAIKNVQACQAAVGATTVEMTLRATGEAVQYTTTDSTVSGRPDRTVTVPGLSLDAVFRAEKLGHCDFVKLDCEGCEFDVLLRAAPATLGKIDHICLEYHDTFTEFSHDDLVRHLQQQGFVVRITPNPAHKYLGFLYAERRSGS